MVDEGGLQMNPVAANVTSVLSLRFTNQRYRSGCWPKLQIAIPTFFFVSMLQVVYFVAHYVLIFDERYPNQSDRKGFSYHADLTWLAIGQLFFLAHFAYASESPTDETPFSPNSMWMKTRTFFRRAFGLIGAAYSQFSFWLAVRTLCITLMNTSKSTAFWLGLLIATLGAPTAISVYAHRLVIASRPNQTWNKLRLLGSLISAFAYGFPVIVFYVLGAVNLPTLFGGNPLKPLDSILHGCIFFGLILSIEALSLYNFVSTMLETTVAMTGYRESPRFKHIVAKSRTFGKLMAINMFMLGTSFYHAFFHNILNQKQGVSWALALILTAYPTYNVAKRLFSIGVVKQANSTQVIPATALTTHSHTLTTKRILRQQQQQSDSMTLSVVPK